MLIIMDQSGSRATHLSWPEEDWYQQWYAGDASVWEDDATPPEEPDVPDTGDDGHLQEAQQAERVAEQLAQEAQRTWVQAKQATAALHRDRGFGKGKSPIKCFNCGGNHMARDCPDRRHPAHPKGAGGKGNSSFMAGMDPYYDIYYFKGKGKNWSSGKGTSAPPRSFVNSYTTEYFGLDMSTKSSKECHSTSLASTQGDFEGMVACGATASAGPELAVQGLIKAVVAQDHSAVIEVDQSARPYFRHGNGKWGRALYQVNISSAVSGETRNFKVYALPNPPELHAPGFQRSMLVPIRIGMDHLGQHGASMMIDFTTGLALNTLEDDPRPYQLRQNHKGHYVQGSAQPTRSRPRSHQREFRWHDGRVTCA